MLVTQCNRRLFWAWVWRTNRSKELKCLSRSQLNYSFLVTTGPKFLCMFFHPTSYDPSFPRINTSFMVQFNEITLIYCFNASLTADAENIETIFREYVAIISERLDLSFIISRLNQTPMLSSMELRYFSFQPIYITRLWSTLALPWRQSIESM